MMIGIIAALLVIVSITAWLLFKVNTELLLRNRRLSEENEMLKIANKALVEQEVKSGWETVISKPPKQSNGRKD